MLQSEVLRNTALTAEPTRGYLPSSRPWAIVRAAVQARAIVTLVVLRTNVVVRWLTLLNPIWKVKGSNLGRGDRLKVFVVFLNLSRQIPACYIKLGQERFLPNPFQTINQLTPWYVEPSSCEV
jgi:hypothetical protein